ncbi:MAG: RNA polymerase sigma factor [Verrucomicrobiota bacterium]
MRTPTGSRYNPPPMDAEAELVRQCLRGDTRAWDDLFDQHYAVTGRFIFQLSSSLAQEDVEEICQEVFLSVVKHLPSFGGKSRLQTWIFRIAVNQTRDYVEKQRAAKRGGGVAPLSLQAEDPESGLTLDPPSTAPSPDLLLAAREDLAVVTRALEQLGEPCREIIELRYFGDLSYDEIGESLQLNLKTVSSRLSKCRDKLEALTRAIILREKSLRTSV